MAVTSRISKKLSVVTLLAALLVPAALQAEEVTTTAAESDKIRHFGVDLSTSGHVGLSKEHPNSYSILEVTGKYFLRPTSSLFLTLSGGKAFTGQEEFFFDDIVLGIQESAIHSFALPDPTIKLRGSFSASLPTSKESRRLGQITALVGSVGAGTLWHNFILGYDIIPAVYLNQFTTAKSGKQNKRFGFGNTLTLGYQFTDDLDFTTTWNLTFLSTYNQKVPKGTYNFTQSLGYQMTPELSLRGGASTKGNQLKHGGTKSNVELYSIDGTELFLSLGLGF